MNLLRTCFSTAVVLLCTSACLDAQGLRAVGFPDESSANLTNGTITAVVRVGSRFGRWTLMGVAKESGSSSPFAVLEDFTSQTGDLVVVDLRGTRFDLPKSAEPTWADPAKLY